MLLFPNKNYFSFSKDMSVVVDCLYCREKYKILSAYCLNYVNYGLLKVMYLCNLCARIKVING